MEPERAIQKPNGQTAGGQARQKGEKGSTKAPGGETEHVFQRPASRSCGVVSLRPGRSHTGFPLAGDQTAPEPKIYVNHVPESQNKRLKVLNNMVEARPVNSLSDSDISKDFMCRHCNTQSTAGKVKDAVFLLVPLFWLSWISKGPL